MQAFKILGGRKLKGEVKPQGAKNEALQIICATLLTSEEVVINNIPDIIDINKLISLLKYSEFYLWKNPFLSQHILYLKYLETLVINAV